MKMHVDGSVAFWTLTAKTDRRKLEHGLTKIGMGTLMPPDRPYPAILRDALTESCGNAKTLIRPLGDRRGFAVVDEDRGHDSNGYAERFTVKTRDTEDGRMSLDFSGNYYDDAPKVRLASAEWHGIASTDQVAGLMVKAVTLLNGIALRPNGAVYWLPGSGTEQWNDLGRVIEEAGNNASKVYMIRHTFDEDAIVAVRDAVIHEIERDSKLVCDEIMTGDLGERALEARQAQAEAMRSKVDLYKTLLSTGLDQLETNLEALSQTIATATIMATSQKRSSAEQRSLV